MMLSSVNLLLSVAMLFMTLFIAYKLPLWRAEMTGLLILLIVRVLFYFIANYCQLNMVIMRALSSYLSVFESAVMIAYGITIVYFIHRKN